jgi:hypothetical protein
VGNGKRIYTKATKDIAQQITAIFVRTYEPCLQQVTHEVGTTLAPSVKRLHILYAHSVYAIKVIVERKWI